MIIQNLKNFNIGLCHTKLQFSYAQNNNETIFDSEQKLNRYGVQSHLYYYFCLLFSNVRPFNDSQKNLSHMNTNMN
jgi:hypothetical protein